MAKTIFEEIGGTYHEENWNSANSLDDLPAETAAFVTSDSLLVRYRPASYASFWLFAPESAGVIITSDKPNSFFN